MRKYVMKLIDSLKDGAFLPDSESHAPRMYTFR